MFILNVAMRKFIPNAENTYRVKLETYLNNQLVVASAENYQEWACIKKMNYQR